MAAGSARSQIWAPEVQIAGAASLPCTGPVPGARVIAMREDDMTSHTTAAPDAAMRDALAALGLEPRLVATGDAEAFEGWQQVVARGFLDPERTAEQVGSARDRLGYRRLDRSRTGRTASTR